MKNILFKILPLVLLFFATSIFAQNQLDNFYYYEGEKVFLDINMQTISISFEGENSINAFSSLKSSSTETSKIIIKTYYMEVSTKNKMSMVAYQDEIENYKRKPNTIMVSPTFKTKEGGKLGLSNNFYVKLKNQKDVDILYQKAKEFNVEVLGHDKYMPLWFTLSITSPQKINALHLANIFYEN